MTTISQPKTIKTENVLINEPVKEVVSNVVSQHKCNNMSFTCHLQVISHVTRWFGTSFFFLEGPDDFHDDENDSAVTRDNQPI
jgi:hypothetical protein